MSGNRFLVRAPETGWVVDHNGEPVSLHLTRAAAVADATARAHDEEAEIVIAADDGKVERDERFGRPEPRDGKG